MNGSHELNVNAWLQRPTFGELYNVVVSLLQQADGAVLSATSATAASVLQSAPSIQDVDGYESDQAAFLGCLVCVVICSYVTMSCIHSICCEMHYSTHKRIVDDFCRYVFGVFFCLRSSNAMLAEVTMATTLPGQIGASFLSHFSCALRKI
jgi:hypothetical protein